LVRCLLEEPLVEWRNRLALLDLSRRCNAEERRAHLCDKALAKEFFQLPVVEQGLSLTVVLALIRADQHFVWHCVENVLQLLLLGLGHLIRDEKLDLNLHVHVK